MLITVLAFNILPISAFSLDLNDKVTSDSFSKIICEETVLREESVKYYLCEDGSYIAAMYATPIHYIGNGEWKDVDNSLVQSESISDKVTYIPKAGLVDISIPQDFSDGQKLSINNDGYSVRFGISTDNIDVSLESNAELTDVANLQSSLIQKQLSKKT